MRKNLPSTKIDVGMKILITKNYSKKKLGGCYMLKIAYLRFLWDSKRLCAEIKIQGGGMLLNWCSLNRPNTISISKSKIISLHATLTYF